jgi:uncharacterized hydrophobic protein (TIGR00271 family)
MRNLSSPFAAAGAAASRHLKRSFALAPGTDFEGTAAQIRADVEFSGGNVWALVFAILIASVGLNVNSTAVIIGAMLISPLMGPIVGAGFGLATSDLPLLRHSLRNILTATVVAVLASSLYFALSPLQDVQSELLARTRPTLYDVLIATFGGSAGVVAVSRRTNKSNFAPGVAIATALVPPLCTAGFGLTQGDTGFFLGALNLFLINALFICLATVGFARLMQFSRVATLDEGHVRRARLVITLVALTALAPAGYTGWSIVQETRSERAARRYVAEALAFPDRSLLNVDLHYARGGSTIRATLLGEPLSDDATGLLERRLAAFGLENTKLELQQPMENRTSTERLSQSIRAGVLQDLYKQNQASILERDERIRLLEDEVVRLKAGDFPTTDIARELGALYPGVSAVALTRETAVPPVDDDGARSVIATVTWRRAPGSRDAEALRAYLAARLRVETVRLVNATAP